MGVGLSMTRTPIHRDAPGVRTGPVVRGTARPSVQSAQIGGDGAGLVW
jgi:hypothetical protein